MYRLTTSFASTSGSDSLKSARPPPKGRRENMGAYPTNLRRQMDFLNELHTEIERLDLLEDVEEAKVAESLQC